jgi:opacity protein-like surface antigen
MTKVRTNNSINGIFKLGIVVKDLMIYGKGGIVRTNWMMSFVDKGNFRAESSISQKFTKDGSLLGFGIDYNLNSNWSIGVDYTVANYPNLKLVHRLGEFKMYPSLRTTTFRLSYLF